MFAPPGSSNRQARSIKELHFGIDQRRYDFSCCRQLGHGASYLGEWLREQLPRSVKKLRPNAEAGLKVAGDSRRFCKAEFPQVARVLGVDTNQFRVLRRAVKETDDRDPTLLALYLS